MTMWEDIKKFIDTPELMFQEDPAPAIKRLLDDAEALLEFTTEALERLNTLHAENTALKTQLKLVQGNAQDRTELFGDEIKRSYAIHERLKIANYQIQRAIAQIRWVSWNSPYQMRDTAQSVAEQLENYMKTVLEVDKKKQNEKPNKKINV